MRPSVRLMACGVMVAALWGDRALAQDDSLDLQGSVSSDENGTETVSNETGVSYDSAQDGIIEEGPDPTRLDVERLPPEAIEVERDLYASGWLFEGWVGGRGFLGDLGNVANPGVVAAVGTGFEWFHWLSVLVALEASFHAAEGPPPPDQGAFELLGAIAALRAQLNFTPEAALWAQGEVGLLMAFGDLLRVYGFDQSDSPGLQFGGTGGFDWHFTNRHTSIGVLGGVRATPVLAGPAESLALAVHGAVYIRYVM